MKCTLTTRMTLNDAHYGSNLVDGSKILKLFEDVATELLIRNDGDEGIFKSYEQVEFIDHIYLGDYIEVIGEIIGFGTSSRKIKFEARKIAISRSDINESAADYLLNPRIVCRASGTCIVPKEKQRL